VECVFYVGGVPKRVQAKKVGTCLCATVATINDVSVNALFNDKGYIAPCLYVGGVGEPREFVEPREFDLLPTMVSLVTEGYKLYGGENLLGLLRFLMEARYPIRCTMWEVGILLRDADGRRHLAQGILMEAVERWKLAI